MSEKFPNQVKREIIIQNGDEMDKFLEGLQEINAKKEKAGKGVLYTAYKETRQDPRSGLVYSVLGVYRFGIDEENPATPVRYMEVVPVDEAGNIVQEFRQMRPRKSLESMAKGVVNFQKKRGMRIKASRMQDIKFELCPDTLLSESGIKPLRTERIVVKDRPGKKPCPETGKKKEVS